ncbi:hypothetical protein [Laspinema olomoucense]|uniref:Uncharacterized protein n=1 Tax=Laspinema olomoucense D3b TaxID=2953688 RepID=A0ABT2NFP1_9CYAN|nr:MULTISPECIES: hypothetical protein [unclassified Laspinema]MCT7980076.1 hypothetical protein [Laspinema sp. D3b]MCT7996404.1 hypothetical protein [Laspinema sp. D3c]
MSFFYGKASECSRRSLLGIHAVWVVRAIALSLLELCCGGATSVRSRISPLLSNSLAFLMSFILADSKRDLGSLFAVCLTLNNPLNIA